jgi:hypothetical protein
MIDQAQSVDRPSTSSWTGTDRLLLRSVRLDNLLSLYRQNMYQ